MQNIESKKYKNTTLVYGNLEEVQAMISRNPESKAYKSEQIYIDAGDPMETKKFEELEALGYDLADFYFVEINDFSRVLVTSKVFEALDIPNHSQTTYEKDELEGTLGYHDFCWHFIQEDQGNGFSKGDIQNHPEILNFLEKQFGSEIPGEVYIYETRKSDSGYSLEEDDKLKYVGFNPELIDCNEIENFMAFERVFASIQFQDNVLFLESAEEAWNEYKEIGF